MLPKPTLKILSLCFILLLSFPFSVFAAEAETAIDTGDTTWILVSATLVLFMFVPGLALFYGAW